MGEGLVRDLLIDGQGVIQIKEKGADCHKGKGFPKTTSLNEKKAPYELCFLNQTAEKSRGGAEF